MVLSDWQHFPTFVRTPSFVINKLKCRLPYDQTKERSVINRRQVRRTKKALLIRKRTLNVGLPYRRRHWPKWNGQPFQKLGSSTGKSFLYLTFRSSVNPSDVLTDSQPPFPSKGELEKLVKKNGGSISQSAHSDEHTIILADKGSF